MTTYKPFRPRFSRSTGVNRMRRGVSVSKLGQLRRFDYGPDWFAIAKERRAMDGHKCAKCGSTDGLQVHHKIPLSKGGQNRLSNLVTLCDRCHGKEHAHSHCYHGGWVARRKG